MKISFVHIVFTQWLWNTVKFTVCMLSCSTSDIEKEHGPGQNVKIIIFLQQTNRFTH